MYCIYLIVFCKTTICLLFLASFLSKIKDFNQFINSIKDFRLLPESLVQPAGVLILISEFLIVVFLLKWQIIAFYLASLLLVIFTGVFTSVLVRKIQANCNCFGINQHQISQIDLIRNFGFLLCSCGGGWLATKSEATVSLTPLHLGITGLIAFVFVLIWAQLSEIYRLFQTY